MIFPADSEIREFAAYYIRAIKIFREEFKNSLGREPSEFELTDFSKMGIIPYGILKQQNGYSKQSQDHASVQQNSSVNKENTNPPVQTKDQPARQNVKTPLDLVLEKYHANLHKVNERRIEISPRFSDAELYHKVSDELYSLKWKKAKGEDAFVPIEGVKA